MHPAFFTNPRRDATYAHELESIGTLNLLAAAAAAGVAHVVLRSFTAVYGARGQNPSFLTEDRALQPDLGARAGCATSWRRSSTRPRSRGAIRSMAVTVLRFAPLFGPGVHTFYTRIFDHRVVPVLHGLRPAGAAPAPRRRAGGAARPRSARRPRGAFNVVPSAADPARSPRCTWPAKVPVPVPHPVAYAGRGPAVGGGRRARRRAASSTTCAIPFVADGEKAARELGFTAAPLQPGRAATRTWRTAIRARPRRGDGGRRRREDAAQGRAACGRPVATRPRRRASRACRARRGRAPAARVEERTALGAARACSSPLARLLLGPARGRHLGERWRASARDRLLLLALGGVGRVRLRPAFTRDACCRSSSSCTRSGGASRRSGIEHVPATGAGLIVANHSGVLP